jgi:hypothetical protein
MAAAVMILTGMVFGMAKGPVAEESVDTASVSVLFVYDIEDEDSRFFISTFRNALDSMNVQYEECAVKENWKKEVAGYDHILVYSRIMAFNMMSPVRKWVKSVKDFDSKPVHLFVTCGRWFEEKHREGLAKAIEKRNGGVVDAVSAATEHMSTKKKKEWVKNHLADVLKVE